MSEKQTSNIKSVLMVAVMVLMIAALFAYDSIFS